MPMQPSPAHLLKAHVGNTKPPSLPSHHRGLHSPRSQSRPPHSKKLKHCNHTIIKVLSTTLNLLYNFTIKHS